MGDARTGLKLDRGGGTRMGSFPREWLTSRYVNFTPRLKDRPYATRPGVPWTWLLSGNNADPAFKPTSVLRICPFNGFALNENKTQILHQDLKAPACPPACFPPPGPRHPPIPGAPSTRSLGCPSSARGAVLLAFRTAAPPHASCVRLDSAPRRPGTTHVQEAPPAALDRSGSQLLATSWRDLI